jgi:hypothetical protein
VENLRHTFAATWLRAGVPIVDLARFLAISVRLIGQGDGHLAPDSASTELTRANRERSFWPRDGTVDVAG